MAVSSALNVPIIALEIIKKMNPAAVFQMLRASLINENFYRRYWNHVKKQMKVNLIICGKRLFLADPRTVRDTVKLLKKGNLPEKTTFGESFLAMECLNNIQQLVDSPVYKGIEIEGITTIGAKRIFVDAVAETLKKLNYSPRVRLSLNQQFGSAGRVLMEILSPKSFEIDANSDEFSPMFIVHPALRSVKHLVYSPHVKRIAVPKRYSSVEIRNCDSIFPNVVRTYYIKSWQKQDCVRFRRFWVSTTPVATECRTILRGVKREWLWSLESHEESFLSDANLDESEMKDLKAVCVIPHPTSRRDIVLLVQATHRLLLHAMSYAELGPALDELKKNPTLR